MNSHLKPHEKHGLMQYLAQFVTPRRLGRMELVLDRRTRYVTAVLEDVYQPHNASAVLRSCEILGIQDVHVVERENEFRPNRDIALGADKWLTLTHYRGSEEAGGTGEALSTLRKEGYQVAAMTLRQGAVSIGGLSLEQPLALCFGTEEEGLSEEAHDLADVFVQLPMYGFTQSFNLSVTAALALSRIMRRLRASDYPWRLSHAERQDLKLQWLLQTVPGGELLMARYLRQRATADEPS